MHTRSRTRQQPTSTPSIELVIRIVVDQSTGNGSVVDVQASPRSDDAMWRPEGGQADGAPHGETDREPTYAEVELVPVDSPRPVHAVGRHDQGPVEQVKRRSNRRPLLAVAAVAASLAGVVAMLSSSGPAFTAREVAMSAPAMSAPAVSAPAIRPVLLDGENGSPATIRSSTAAAASIAGARCAELIVAAALTLRADPATWIAGVLESGGRHHGLMLDQVIRDRLVTARRTLDRGHNSDAGGVTTMAALDAVIAQADSQPCAATACPLRDQADESDAATAGWQWVCPVVMPGRPFGAAILRW